MTRGDEFALWLENLSIRNHGHYCNRKIAAEVDRIIKEARAPLVALLMAKRATKKQKKVSKCRKQ